jgi:zinc transport system substrate-binding protein
VEVEGKEPKPAEIMGLVKLARAEGITVIFIQPQFSSRSARTIANAIGGELVVADDLSGDWESNLRAVAEQFKSALR